MAEGRIYQQDALLENHDEYFDYPCTRCERKGRNTEAECYCKTCRQHFCTRCRSDHGEFASDHVVVKVSGSKVARVSDEAQIPVRIDTDDCQLHTGQQITIYCGQHEVFCCAVCSTLDHSKCETKDFIPDLANNVAQSHDMTSLISTIATTQRRLHKVQGEKKQSQTSLADSRSCYKATTKEFRNQVVAMLRRIEQATDDTMDQLYSTRSGKLQQQLDSCDELTQEFQDLTTQLSDGSISDAKRFVLMKHGQKRMLQCAEELNSLSQPTNYDIVFRLDNPVLKAIEEVKVLGQFDETPGHGSSTEITGVKNNRECKIRAGSDKKSCDIQGICMLADGTIILTDHKNENIKRLDEQYYPTETCPMAGSPNGVCCIDTKEIAVALGSKKKVQIVTITDKMRATEQLTFKHKCYSIAYSNDVLYITSWGLSPTLHEYILARNSGGYTCHKIRSFSDTQPRNVALSMDGTFVYLVGIHDKLMIRNRNGGFVQNTEHPNMKKYGESPGVCVDSKGNVLVSLQYVGILQFKNSGTESNGMLLKEGSGTSQPELAFVDHLRSKLLIQRNKVFGGSDTMDVWDLIY